MDPPATFLDQNAVLAFLQEETDYPLPNIEQFLTEVSDASTMTSSTTDPIDTQQERAAPYLSEREQLSLLLNGHTYTKKYAKKDRSIVWRCTNRTCRGRTASLHLHKT